MHFLFAYFEILPQLSNFLVSGNIKKLCSASATMAIFPPNPQPDFLTHTAHTHTHNTHTTHTHNTHTTHTRHTHNTHTRHTHNTHTTHTTHTRHTHGTHNTHTQHTHTQHTTHNTQHTHTTHTHTGFHPLMTEFKYPLLIRGIHRLTLIPSGKLFCGRSMHCKIMIWII